MKMEEWKECKLGDICNISSSKRIFAEEYVSSGIPFYRGKEIIEKHNKNTVSSELFITHERFAEIKSKFPVPQIDDILLTSVGTLGIPWLVNESNFYFKDGNLTWFRSNTEKVNPKFLYYWFDSNYAKNQIDSMCIGSTQKALTIDTLSKFSINLPPLPTQQKIAAILSSLDDKIELNNKINTNLEQQAQALFKNWFVDDASELIENEIGKMDILITDYVANGSFKDLADNVKYLSHETDNVLIRLTDYNNNYSSDMVYISDESYNFLEKSKLFGDEIIISNVGANVGTVFRCPRLNKRMSLAPNSIMIRGGIYEHYLYLYFTSTYGQGLLKSIVTGSAQPKFNKTNFRSLKIQIPREEKLKEFNLIYDSLYEKMINNQKENLHLASLRNTLLPKLMNREIEV